MQKKPLRNTPTCAVYVAQEVAEIRSPTEEAVARITPVSAMTGALTVAEVSIQAVIAPCP